ncbi:putative copper-importing P-type ATPase A [Phycisphaerae bacterium RAS1]|nr:putative copper-importing P-type ATPase A [Phycisphaerae bacterium RAS1]
MAAEPLLAVPVEAPRSTATADVLCAHCGLPVPPGLVDFESEQGLSESEQGLFESEQGLVEPAGRRMSEPAAPSGGLTLTDQRRSSKTDVNPVLGARGSDRWRADGARGSDRPPAERIAALQFCCNGCRAVYAVIHGCGLEHYYRLRSAAAAAPQAARTSGRSYAEFDDPAFEKEHVHEAPQGLRSVELLLAGVHCGACVWLVEKLPSVAPGVLEARLELRRGVVRVTWDPLATRLSSVARVLDSLGYPAHVARDGAAVALRRREERRLLIRIAIAAALAGNVMLCGFALYGGVFATMESEFSRLFRWMSAVLGMTSLLGPGFLFFRGAWAAIRTRTAHLDLPIAVGLATGAVVGTANTLLNRGEIYFDSLTVLVFLLLVGRWIQRKQQRVASDAVELLYSLTPGAARRIEKGVVSEVAIESLKPGDLLEVRAGDVLPVDGLIERGASAVDESLLTGESRPRDVHAGQRVAAGTLNVSGRLEVRAEAAGSASRVGKLMQLVEQAARQPAPIVRLADRIAGHFTAAMLLLAVATAAAWLLVDPSRALDHATALLIVTCPCALGLSTPLTLTVAIGRAARAGFLVKGGLTLELLARRGTIFLDKTGTLTQGRMRMLEWLSDDAARPLVRAVESHSSHPIARAMVEALTGEREVVAAAVQQHAAGGIEGRVDGRHVLVGSPRFVLASGAAASDEIRGHIAGLLHRARTPVLVAVDAVVVAVAGMGDPLRADAPAAVNGLRALGWNVAILSGDHPQVVAAVGEALGIPPQHCHGDVAPERKLAMVRDEMTRGPVVMIGDGVNDSAALAAASVGIAVQGGAEASLAAAAVYLNRAGLTPVVELMSSARRAYRAIRRGLAISIFYNAIAAALAMTGLISPLIAAILMPISSFTVLSIALSARTFDDARRGGVRAEEPGETAARAECNGRSAAWA